MTQRKRATGFALMDTAFSADAKFLRLARQAPGTSAYAAAVGVYWLLVADARRNRDRVINWDDYTEYAAEIAALKEAKLLVDDGFAEEAFERWAPAYKSPYDRVRNATQGYAEQHESTQATLASTQLASNPLSSPQSKEGGPGETIPGESDTATIACRSLMDGGRWLGDREYVTAWEDLDRRYTAEWVRDAIQPAVAELTAKGKVRAWDLKRLVDLRCAERSRTEENERQRRVADAARLESERLRAAAEAATEEERQRASIMRRAVGLWIKRKPTEPVPTDFDALASWLEQNGGQPA